MSIDPVSLAITIALNVASMALQASKKSEGPRLDDLKASTADYGTPLVQFYGTMRLECPCFYAEDIREEKHQSKTKGGKYNEFKYFGTWASFIADNPIDAVIQTYLDRHLVMDRTGSGPVEALISADNVRYYLGTETQTADPRMVATIEGREGPGTCPAYLGVSYAMFEDVPLEKFGNRLPQVSVTATRNAIPHFPYYSTTGLNSLLNSRITPDHKRLITTDSFSPGNHIQVWDLTTRTRVLAATSEHADTGSDLAVISNSGFYGVTGGLTSPTLWLFDLFGGAVDLGVDFEAAAVGGCAAAAGEVFIFPPFSAFHEYSDASGTLYSTGFGPTCFFGDVDNQAWVVGPVGSGGKVRFSEARSGVENEIATGFDSSCAALDNGNGQYFLFQSSGRCFLVDKATFAITHTSAAAAGSTSGASLRRAFSVAEPGAGTIWVGFDQWNTQTGELIRTVNPFSWKVAGSTRTIYDPLNDAIISEEPFTGTDITWRFLDRQTGGAWLLGDICADAASQAGMLPTEYDFSDLDQEVPGFAWTQGPAGQIVSPLLDLWDSDIRPHGWIQQGLKRGQALTGDVITREWMVRESAGQKGTPLYSVPETAETDLPRRLFATFSDPNMDYQPNTAVAQRNAASVKTDREQPLDFTTLAIGPEVIQPLLERDLRRYWVGATKPQCIVTPLEIRLEPGDVRMLELDDGELLRCRCTRMKIRANRMIDTEWELDGETPVDFLGWEDDQFSPLSTVYSTPGGFTYGRDPDVVFAPVPTMGFVLDTPLLSDADDQTAPFLYDAAAPFASSGFWPGSGVWSADDNEADTVFTAGWDSFASDGGATWGFVTGTLPSAATDVIDEATELTVTMITGEALTSVTQDQLLANRGLNLALVGDELIQFRDATETDPNQYTLTGLIRGARGTEWAVGDHVAGETILVITSAIHRRTIGASEIGDTDYYKFSTTGDDLDATLPIAVPFAANAHRPLSVAHLALQRNSGTGNWTISWVRRTRIGGSSVNGQDVPLGETSELYRVKIMNGDTVVNTYEVTSPSKVYTAAEQVADWGGAQTGLTVTVVQMSPALSLEGFEASASG